MPNRQVNPLLREVLGDSLRDIRVAALDKTGTLTEGVFEVNAVLPQD